MKTLWTLAMIASLTLPVMAQQRADENFRLPNLKPAFSAGEGPRVCIDAAHHNFQESNPGAYQAFANVLGGDGYRVKETSQVFSQTLLQECEILVIATATAAENVQNPTFPHRASFERHELEALYEWLRGGGGLLLISDHTPSPAGIADLTTMLGAVTIDGHSFLKPQFSVSRSIRARGWPSTGPSHSERPQRPGTHRQCGDIPRLCLPGFSRMGAPAGLRTGGRSDGGSRSQLSRHAARQNAVFLY